MAKYIELKSQIEELQKEAEILRKRERAETIANIKEAITAFDLTAEDLGLSASRGRGGRKPGVKAGSGARRRDRPAKKAAAVSKRGRKAGKKTGHKSAGNDKRSVVAPKYRNASTGATWTGRGKQPKWLALALKGGKKLEDFKI